MVETNDEKFAKQTARQWGESKLDTPFERVELHQGVLDSPDLDSDIFNGVRVWELPFWFDFIYPLPIRTPTKKMYAVTDRHFRSQKAILRDYARFTVKGESYPGIIPVTNAITEVKI